MPVSPFADVVRALRRSRLPSTKRQRLPRAGVSEGLLRDYERDLNTYAKGVFDLVDFDALRSLFESRADNARIDTAASDFFDALRARATSQDQLQQIETLARSAATRLSEFQKRQLRQQVNALFGVDPFLRDPNLSRLLSAFAVDNVSLIRTVPTRLFDAMETTLTAALREGTPWRQVANSLVDVGSTAGFNARRIARDQLGKLYSQIAKERHNEIGVTAYFWRTANDARVRDSHQHREGKRFLWNNPPTGGHPGDAILCRCYAEPDLEGLLGV